MSDYPRKQLFMTALASIGRPIIVDVIGENPRIQGGLYIRYPDGRTDTTTEEFLFDLPWGMGRVDRAPDPIEQAARAQGAQADIKDLMIASDMLEDYASALDNGDLDGAGHSLPSAVRNMADILNPHTSGENQGGVPDRVQWRCRQSRGGWTDLKARPFADLAKRLDDWKAWGLIISSPDGVEQYHVNADLLALLTTSPNKPEQEWVRCEPDLMWDADSPEESCAEDAFEFANDRAADMPADETMVVNVMCAKILPSRKMKIWVDENEDLQWEWIESPQPPQEQRGAE